VVPILTFSKKSVKLSPHKFRKLREEVFKRDRYRCQLPGCYRTKALHPHHIIPTGRLRLDIKENLLTVCFECHDGLHDNLLDVSIDDLIDEHNLRGYLK
jgi:5-methylcytosine-specific restriction endonuclease McrA